MQLSNCPRWFPLICTGAVLCVVTLITPHAYGQVYPTSLSAEAREKLYGEVDAAFEALERQGNLLKNVVRLVTPTVVHIEGDTESPINRGTLCSKGISLKQYVVNDRRLTKPLYLAPEAELFRVV